MRPCSLRLGDLPVAGVFLYAVAFNLSLENVRAHPAGSVVVSLLLATPFAVLLWGQVTMATTWKRDLYFFIGSVLMLCPFGFASFVGRWMHMPFSLVMGMTLVLCGVAAAYNVLGDALREPRRCWGLWRR